MFGFDTALQLLKAGNSVHRQGWNGKGMHVKVQVPDMNSKTRSYLYIKGVDASLCPWTPSQTDILAEDWMLV